MAFLQQTFALTATALRSIGERRGAALVTVIGVTTVVGVLVSLLAMGNGARSLGGSSASPNEDVVLGSGASSSQQSVLTRDEAIIVKAAPGIQRAPDGTPYYTATTMVSVDAIRSNGKRGSVALVGFTPGIKLFDPPKLIEGRMYRPGVHELIVSDPIRRMYRGLGVGDHITLRGTDWTVVGVFAISGSVNDSILAADADTVMSAFGENTYQQVLVKLTSPAAYPAFKKWLTSNPTLSVQVKTEEDDLNETFGQFIRLFEFVAYFIGGVMACGAIFGALNSLYASVDARRRDLATLRAIGFGGGPIIASVLIEGMLLALPGALIGAAIAWILFNGHVVSTSGLILRLDVTPQLLIVSIAWALAIGLVGASLPALRAARVPVAVALRAT